MDVDDMDIDLDLDVGVEHDLAEQAVSGMVPELTEDQRNEHSQDVPAAYLDQDVGIDPDRPQRSKVFIRGLDSFTTENVENFAREHYDGEAFNRIEWIDDTSANIVYANPEAAVEALDAFSKDDTERSKPPNQLRAAKRLSTHILHGLEVRQAVTADRKKKRAHEASRFYLLNPDQNPHENGTFDRQRRGRGREERGDYRRRKFDDREHSRRQNGDQFNVDMYDDGPGVDVALSDAGVRQNRRRRGRRGSDADLFDGPTTKGRLRNRSASPLGDGDGRLGFADDQPRRSTARPRSISPDRLYQQARRRELFPGHNSQKELFPSNGGEADGSAMDTNGAVKELFPDHSQPLYTGSGPIPHKKTLSNHRRTAAFDAKDETTLERFSPNPRSLAERVTGGPQSSPLSGNGGGAQGFQFKGAAKNAKDIVRELFPDRTGNEGKELFGEKIKGRGGQRRRAEDMF